MIRLRGAPALDVLFSGGGTAGHIEPALALARGLVAHGHARERVHFVGARQGMESRLVPEAGFTITLLPGRGIRRRLTLANLSALLGLSMALVQAIVLVGRRRPGVVVTLGGYAGLPGALAGAIWRVPLVVVNLDAAPGASNRLVSHFATRCTLAFPTPGMRRPLLTGAPLRESVLAAATARQDPRLIREHFGIATDRAVLVVVGGSLGAERLNTAALGLARALLQRDDLVLVHIAGARNYERAQGDVAALDLASGALDYRLLAFEAELPALFAVAALVISRAGAMTVAELAAIGTPSVLVPLPNAPADHQRLNAMELERAGGAIVVRDDEATSGHLLSLITPLLASPVRLEEMARAARSLGRRDATERIVALVEELGATTGARS